MVLGAFSNSNDPLFSSINDVATPDLAFGVHTNFPFVSVILRTPFDKVSTCPLCVPVVFDW